MKAQIKQLLGKALKEALLESISKYEANPSLKGFTFKDVAEAIVHRKINEAFTGYETFYVDFAGYDEYLATVRIVIDIDTHRYFVRVDIVNPKSNKVAYVVIEDYKKVGSEEFSI